jgi:ubiquinone/menaquinone biosynthesis C-methylase UbiE
MEKMAEKKILDVGCGRAKHAGAIGIDWMSDPSVDIVHDLNKFPWPIADNAFDEIICQDTIQLFDNVVKIMEEMHRIGKPGAILKIRTPHFSHPNSFRDPMHKWHFTIDTFDYFTDDFEYPIYTDKKYRMIKKEFIFTRKWGLGAMLARVSPRRYEKYHCHRSPPYNMYFELEVIKR